MSLPGQFHFGGRVLAGRYQLQGRVSHGHQGVLYRAIDQRGGAPVAVKLLFTPPDPERFSSLQALLHPRLARLLDAGSEDGQPFVVGEWLDGYFLDLELAKNPLGSARILSLMAAVCEGVAAMNGFSHGAVLLRNLFVGRPASPLDLAGSDVKLCDPLLSGSPAADLAACRELLRLLMKDGAAEPLAAISAQEFTTVAELGAACAAALSALTVEQMNTVGTRPPPPPPPPMPLNMPTNWSPPPPREEFQYGTASIDDLPRPITNPSPPPNWNR